MDKPQLGPQLCPYKAVRGSGRDLASLSQFPHPHIGRVVQLPRDSIIAELKCDHVYKSRNSTPYAEHH